LGITVQLTRAGGAAPNPAKMQMDSPEHLQFPEFVSSEETEGMM